MKDREKVMENVVTHEDWKACFVQHAPGLVLFARQWVRSAAAALLIMARVEQADRVV
ncbi:MAG: hypothetical protein M3R59_05940 [Verrucomicrobiota bacterium]|nr:hypothetical protein [Verrucomicrobiota bacterium]